MTFNPGDQVMCVLDISTVDQKWHGYYPDVGEIVTIDYHMEVSGYVTLKEYGRIEAFTRLSYPSWCFEKVMSDKDLQGQLTEIFK